MAVVVRVLVGLAGDLYACVETFYSPLAFSCLLGKAKEKKNRKTKRRKERKKDGSTCLKCAGVVPVCPTGT